MPRWYGGSALNPDEMLPKRRQWEMQYNRLVRWHTRILGIRKKAQSHALCEHDIDDLIAFFLTCYHLRDWIKACRPETCAELDELFKHFEMGACRDVCNGFKHKNLDKPTHDADFNLYREYDHFQADAEPTRDPVSYRLAFSDGNDVRKYDAFELAESCFGLWMDFIRTQRLLPDAAVGKEVVLSE